MAAEAVPTSPCVGVRGEEALHAAVQVRLRGLENEVEVVGLEDEGMDLPGTAAHGAAEVVLEPPAVVVVAGAVLPPMAAGHDVVNRAAILDAKSSWHPSLLTSSTGSERGKNPKPGRTQCSPCSVHAP